MPEPEGAGAKITPPRDRRGREQPTSVTRMTNHPTELRALQSPTSDDHQRRERQAVRYCPGGEAELTPQCLPRRAELRRFHRVHSPGRKPGGGDTADLAAGSVLPVNYAWQASPRAGAAVGLPTCPRRSSTRAPPVRDCRPVARPDGLSGGGQCQLRGCGFARPSRVETASAYRSAKRSRIAINSRTPGAPIGSRDGCGICRGGRVARLAAVGGAQREEARARGADAHTEETRAGCAGRAGAGRGGRGGASRGRRVGTRRPPARRPSRRTGGAG